MAAYRLNLGDLKSYMKERNMQIPGTQIPNDLYFQPELLWQEEPAKEVVEGKLHGATTRTNTEPSYRIASVMKTLRYPEKTLEEKVTEKKPKTTVKLKKQRTLGIRNIIPVLLYFEDEPVEDEQKYDEV